MSPQREQNELFGNGGDNGSGFGESKQGHVGPTNDEYLNKTEQTHDSIEDTLVGDGSLAVFFGCSI